MTEVHYREAVRPAVFMQKTIHFQKKAVGAFFELSPYLSLFLLCGHTPARPCWQDGPLPQRSRVTSDETPEGHIHNVILTSSAVGSEGGSVPPCGPRRGGRRLAAACGASAWSRRGRRARAGLGVEGRANVRRRGSSRRADVECAGEPSARCCAPVGDHSMSRSARTVTILRRLLRDLGTIGAVLGVLCSSVMAAASKPRSRISQRGPPRPVALEGQLGCLPLPQLGLQAEEGDATLAVVRTPPFRRSRDVTAACSAVM